MVARVVETFAVMTVLTADAQPAAAKDACAAAPTVRAAAPAALAVVEKPALVVAATDDAADAWSKVNEQQRINQSTYHTYAGPPAVSSPYLCRPTSSLFVSCHGRCLGTGCCWANTPMRLDYML